MRFLWVFFLSFLFINTVHATTHIYTVQIATFHAKKNAQRSQKQLQHIFSTNTNLSKFQRDAKFDFYVTKKGKYFVVRAEPIFTKEILLKILPEIRKYYRDAYVKKITFNQLIEPLVTCNATKPVVDSKPTTVQRPPVQKRETKQQETLKPAKKIQNPQKTKSMPMQSQKRTPDALYAVIVVLFLLLCIAIYLLLRYRKKVQELTVTLQEEHNKIMQESLFDIDDIEIDLEDLDLGDLEEDLKEFKF